MTFLTFVENLLRIQQVGIPVSPDGQFELGASAA